MPRGRHSIDRAGYADDIYEYAEEIREGVGMRYSGIADVSDVREAQEYTGWPAFSIESESDAPGDDITIDCVIGVDDDGSLVAQVFLVDDSYDDWNGAALTATVNDDGSVSTGDMSADVNSIIGAISDLVDRNV